MPMMRIHEGLVTEHVIDARHHTTVMSSGVCLLRILVERLDDRLAATVLKD